MTFLLCPLCGKQTSMARFDPTGFDFDVMTQEVVGLGKGKGFASTGRASILGHNSTCEAIKDRILDLLELFYENDLVTSEEIAMRFGLSTVDQLEIEKDEVQSMREEREAGYAKIRGLIDNIEETLETYGEHTFNDEDGLDAALSALRDAIQSLIDERSAVQEGIRDTLDSIQSMINDIESALGSEGEFTIDESGGLENAIDQLKNAVQRVLDEPSAGGENYESSS